MTIKSTSVQMQIVNSFPVDTNYLQYMISGLKEKPDLFVETNVYHRI